MAALVFSLSTLSTFYFWGDLSYWLVLILSVNLEGESSINLLDFLLIVGLNEQSVSYTNVWLI